MMLFTLNRVLRSLVVLLLATFLARALLSLVPGSVAAVMLGDNANSEAIAQLESQLGLDRSLIVQYVTWLGDVVQGDFGTSLLTRQPVLDAVLDRLPVTLEIALLALAIALAVAVPLAMAGASRPGSMIDRVSTVLASAAQSIPAFVAAPVLVFLFAIQLDIFPVTGWRRIEEGLGPNLLTALLPAVAVALPEIAAFQRLLRADLGRTLGEEFVEAARARGLSRRYVVWRHALRPSSFSLLTLAALSFGRTLGGTVIVEALFALPGLGQLVAQSITSRDIIVVQGVVVFIVIGYVVLNTLVDISYGFLDPRVRKEVVR